MYELLPSQGKSRNRSWLVSPGAQEVVVVEEKVVD